MFERVYRMLVKEFIQTLRDPRMRVVTFVIPVFQVLVIGYAVTTDVKHVPTAVYDLDRSVASRELISRFAGSIYFDVVEYVETDARMQELLDHGDALAVLRINHGFAADLAAGRPAAVQLILDGTDSNTAGIVLGYASRITTPYSRALLLERLERQHGGLEQVGQPELRVRAWFNENLESRNFYVPGVIMIVVSLASLLLTSMAVVREKEIGTMEQIMVTPIRPLEFVLGKTLPFAVIGMADVIIVTTVGTLWFGVPIHGSLALLLGSAAVYITTMLGFGLLISTVSQTQQQAMMSTFFFFFPAMLLSGFAFPVANMPTVVQWLTYLNPLRYFLAILRGIFLKGVGLEVLWPQLAALAAMGALVLWGVAVRFRKTYA
jgi:ABC-2 type transport system permease protein